MYHPTVAKEETIEQMARLLPAYMDKGRGFKWAQFCQDHPALSAELKLENNVTNQKSILSAINYRGRTRPEWKKYREAFQIRSRTKPKSRPLSGTNPKATIPPVGRDAQLEKASPVRAQLHALGGDNIQVNPVTVAPFCPHCGAHRNHWGNQ